MSQWSNPRSNWSHRSNLTCWTLQENWQLAWALQHSIMQSPQEMRSAWEASLIKLWLQFHQNSISPSKTEQKVRLDYLARQFAKEQEAIFSWVSNIDASGMITSWVETAEKRLQMLILKTRATCKILSISLKFICYICTTWEGSPYQWGLHCSAHLSNQRRRIQENQVAVHVHHQNNLQTVMKSLNLYRRLSVLSSRFFGWKESTRLNFIFRGKDCGTQAISGHKLYFLQLAKSLICR